MFEIYDALRKKKLTKSQRHFSSNWLGRHPNYVSDTGWDSPSALALAVLHGRLQAAGEHDLAVEAFSLLTARASDYTQPTGPAASTCHLR